MGRALAFAAALGFVACGDDGPRFVGEAAVVVESYDYAFDLESREAAVAIEVRTTADGDGFRLPFRAEGLDPEVTIDGEVASGALAGGVLELCGRGWAAESTLAVVARMRVPLETVEDSQVGYSVSTDGEGAEFYYLVSWVGGCDQFGPCDSAPDRFAHYRFTVAHPAGVQVLCSGTVTAGETETSCDFALDGGPTYSTFGLVASPSWTTTELGSWPGGADGDVVVTLYDHPSSGIAEAIETAQHSGFLGWMAERFGPYPFGDELRLVVGPTYWNGFEHPGNIVLRDQLARPSPGAGYTDPLEHTIDHEIAHQWAGDQTTLSGLYDFVWKEAMAEYLTFVYEDEELGPEGETTARAWKSFASGAGYYPIPAEEPELLHYYGEVYGPGPLILFRQIEALFDRDAVMAALASLLGRERAIGVVDVQAALEDATGADLTGYLDTWAYGSGAPVWPRFGVEVSPAGPGTVDVTVTQEENPGGLFGCAFAIELQGKGDETQEVWIDLGPDGMDSLTVSAEVPFAVADWRFDPHAHCLATEFLGAAAPIPRHPPGWSPWRAP
jgi:aminopeptidase N